MKTQNITPKIILGSSSIYRKELLQRLQIPFETTSPQINEMPLSNESPEETAARLAEAKARAVAKIYPQALIIGSDQVAALGDFRLGKPLNHANATEQLRRIRGKEAVFYTALCLLNSFTDRLQVRVIPYHVKFRQFSDQQIENYLLKEQPYHCAGSAKSEGLGIALIEHMTGDDPSGLIGLPLIALVDMLAQEGMEVI
ncbi:MAG: Maf family nucleotide pyrophosphatase [Nitrosomonas sp.]